MNKNDLIGLTIKEAKEKIKRAESKSDIYQVYIGTFEHIERNFFDIDKKYHYHNNNSERVYHIIKYDLITFARDDTKQEDSFILDCRIEQGEHDNWSFNGFESTQKHNIYYLFIDGIKKGNKGNTIIENKTKEFKAYKEGELTKAQKRFTL